MASNEIVRTRIESELKAEATKVLAEMGVTVSQAIRMLLIQVVQDKELPFKVKARTLNARAQGVSEATDRGEGIVKVKSSAEMFERLGI
jgi:DNA-damage-inducible protein J